MMRRRPRSTLSPYTTLFRSCHCTVAAGTPDAVAVNAASCPGLTLWSFGCPVTTGALSTVRVAAWVVAAPAGVVNTARKIGRASGREGVEIAEDAVALQEKAAR